MKIEQNSSNDGSMYPLVERTIGGLVKLLIQEALREGRAVETPEGKIFPPREGTEEMPHDN